MMRLTPIIKQDIELKSRSLTLPVLMTIFNAILFVVGLAGSSGIMLAMKQSLSSNYGAFLRVYVLVVMLEYILVLFTAPLFTAGSISGEKERGTYDLLLTTNLSVSDIVLEKLVSALFSMCAIIVSGLPAMLVPLMFGGVHIQSTILLMFMMILESLLVLSIGMFASCIGRSVVKSISIAYAITSLLVFGPILLSALTSAFMQNGNNSFAYLSAADPLLPIGAMVLDQIGEHEMLYEIFMLLHLVPDKAFVDHAVLIGIILQLAMSFGFIILSIVCQMGNGFFWMKGRLEKHRYYE